MFHHTLPYRLPVSLGKKKLTMQCIFAISINFPGVGPLMLRLSKYERGEDGVWQSVQVRARPYLPL